jgi:pimeloyl-ACP methyl ester carboxylesterase
MALTPAEKRLASVTSSGLRSAQTARTALPSTLAEMDGCGNFFGSGSSTHTRNKSSPPSIISACTKSASIRGAGYKDTRITEKQIQDIRVPTLAIVGADDPFKVGVDKLKQLLPKTKVVVIDHAHHLDVYTRPEFVSALKQFLDDNRQPAKK